MEWQTVRDELIKRALNEGIEVEGDEVPTWLEDLGIYSLTDVTAMIRDALVEVGKLLWQGWVFMGGDDGWCHRAVWVVSNNGEEYYVTIYEAPYYMRARGFRSLDDAARELASACVTPG